MIKYAVGAIINNKFTNLFKDLRTYSKESTAKRVRRMKQEYVEKELVVQEVEVVTNEEKIKIAIECMDYVLNADPINYREVIYSYRAKIKGEG